MSADGETGLAVAAYPVEDLRSWPALERKLDAWVGAAVAADASLLVFPEYAGIEAAFAAAPSAGRDVRSVCRHAAAAAPRYLALGAELARRHGAAILTGSLPCECEGRLVNRAHLHLPDGRTVWQDKTILTPWERAHTPLQPGVPPEAIETPFGRIGILICYDAEFPLLARSLSADVLLIPACTDDAAGQARLAVAARARALEGQGVCLHAPLLGGVPECPLVDTNYGRAGIYAPPDRGFPEDGVLARGDPDRPGWVHARFDLRTLPCLRRAAAVTIRTHWPESDPNRPKAEP